MRGQHSETLAHNLLLALKKGFETVGVPPMVVVLPIVFDQFPWLGAYAFRPLFPLGLPSLFGFFHNGHTSIPAVVSSVDSLGQIVVPALLATLVGLISTVEHCGSRGG
jgi:hypothetical protein